MKNTIIKDTVILTLITLVSGGLLGLVYQVTKEPIAQQEETIQTQTATIDSQAAAIQELEAAGTAESVKAELQEAYVEGVESNG